HRAGPRPIVVATAEPLTGRPLGAPAAAAAGAAAARGPGPGAPRGYLRPAPPRPPPPGAGARTRGLGPARGAGRTPAPPGPGLGGVVEGDGAEALAAFPHLGPLAGELAARESALAAVRSEVARLIGRDRPPVDRALRDLGLDSLMLEELRRRLEVRFARPLPP